jgi:hypothetical protein
MRLRPRHYVLIAVILALGVFNFVRSRRAHDKIAVFVTRDNSTFLGPVSQSAAWQSFDQAAALRDAPDPQFQPALHAFDQQIDSASAAEKPDLHGCQTWLLFYREGALHASANDTWRQRSTQHLNTCVSQHRDVSS